MRERIRKHLSQNKNIMQKFLRILPFIHPRRYSNEINLSRLFANMLYKDFVLVTNKRIDVTRKQNFKEKKLSKSSLTGR